MSNHTNLMPIFIWVSIKFAIMNLTLIKQKLMKEHMKSIHCCVKD